MIVDSKIISKILFKDVFNEKLPYIDLLKDIIVAGLNDGATRFIMHIMLNPDFVILNKRDYFKIKVSSDCISSKMREKELDILSDIGLYKDGCIYGQILDSNDYSTEFNEHHHSMNVELFLYDTEKEVNKIKEIKYIDCEVKTWELIKLIN